MVAPAATQANAAPGVPLHYFCSVPTATPAETPAAAAAGIPLQFGAAGLGSVVPFTYAGASTPALSAQPWRRVGIASNRMPDHVPVEVSDRYILADLFLLYERERAFLQVRAALDSGAHFTSVSLPIVDRASSSWCVVAYPVFARGAAGRHGVGPACRCHGAYDSVAAVYPDFLGVGEDEADFVCDHAGDG